MTDPYFKKSIEYNFQGEPFVFDVAETLFSTFEVDFGTDLLLRTLASTNPKSILDLGCGYGPLGIVLAKKNPKAKVLLLDRDLLAVRYAHQNISKNNISYATTLGSVGMEKVGTEKFDLIVSNIPAKIGDQAIEEEFILKPYAALNPGGDFWFVVVSGLNRLIPKIGTRNNLSIKEVKKRHGHSVYHLHRP